MWGTMQAQDYHRTYNYHQWDNVFPLIGEVHLNGEVLASSNYEIAAFVGDEVRGTEFLLEADPTYYPGVYFAWLGVSFTNNNETVTFKLYDHAQGIEYDNCSTTVLSTQNGYGEEDNPLIIEFTAEEPISYGPDYPWVVSIGFENYMYLETQIQINGVPVSNTNWEVGAFCGDECRGLGDADDWWVSPVDQSNILTIVVGGATGDVINFYLYDVENQEVFPGFCNVALDWVDGDIGNMLEPYVLNFVTVQTFTKDITAYQGDKDHYYLIASPIGAVMANEVNHLRDNNFDFYSFEQNPEIDPETGLGLEWINHREEAEYELQPGIGYLYANSEDVTLEFTGNAYENVNGDTKEVELAYTEDTEFAGCNLVGNPFSEPAFLSHDYYRMNENGYEIIAVATDVDGLPAMEGCFVFAEDGEENVVFSTTNTNVKRATLALNLSKGRSVIDRAVVRFGESRRLPKFQINKNNTKVYIPMDNKDYAVVSSEGMGEMPVNFKAAENGNYSLTASSAEVSFSYLHLIDNMTGTDVDLLATPSYSFDARTTDYASRFRLVFATGNSVEDDSFGFINGNGNLCIFGIEGEATLQVIDVTGRILSTETFSGSYEKQLNVAPGVYVLHLINGDNIKSQKMVVKR